MAKTNSNAANPANERSKLVDGRDRIPMSTPQLKLATAEIAGYHLHWMRGDAPRINQALRAGYEFVEQDEVSISNTDLAGDSLTDGNTDLGSRVSISAGSDMDSTGQPERLILMKIRQEWWDADQEVIAKKNDDLAATLRGDSGLENAYIPEHAKKTVQTMFTKKH